jgi:hypothetical protein
LVLEKSGKSPFAEANETDRPAVGHPQILEYGWAAIIIVTVGIFGWGL